MQNPTEFKAYFLVIMAIRIQNLTIVITLNCRFSSVIYMYSISFLFLYAWWSPLSCFWPLFSFSTIYSARFIPRNSFQEFCNCPIVLKNGCLSFAHQNNAGHISVPYNFFQYFVCPHETEGQGNYVSEWTRILRVENTMTGISYNFYPFFNFINNYW